MKMIVLLFFLTTCCCYSQEAVPAAEKVYTYQEVDVKPEYPGGINAFFAYIRDNMRMPDVDSDINATVRIGFTVDTDGKLSDIEILNNPGHGLGEEGRRVFLLNKAVWSPGIFNGTAVRVRHSIPIKVLIKVPKTDGKKQ